MSKFIYIAGILLSIITLSSLPSVFAEDDESILEWLYSDVRWIDTVDESVPPNQDLIAVYNRLSRSMISFRLDLLEVTAEQDYDIYIYVDSQPGVNTSEQPNTEVWEYLIYVPSTGNNTITSGFHNNVVRNPIRIFRDIDQNIVEITVSNLNLEIAASGSRYWVVITRSDNARVVDDTGPVLVGGTPPPPINIGFVFWNAIDGATPSEVLRSWAGAHAGPVSSRHGLLYLLEAASFWKFPVAICGLKTPRALSNFKYLQVTDYLQNVEDLGLLVIPAFCDRFFHLINTDFPVGSQASGIDMVDFIKHISAGNDPGRTGITWIGGDFSRSVLGSPEISANFFAYLARHPWIRVYRFINNPDYHRTSPALLSSASQTIPLTTMGVPIPSSLTVAELQAIVRSALARSPDNLVTDMAWSAYQEILVSDRSNLVLARGSYLSQVGHLLAAAQWVDRPQTNNSCDQDIDWDGQAECIISSETLFTTFEMDGGTLLFAFSLNSNGVHQIIGPTTQFDVMLSDASAIDDQKGIIGDPGQIYGAFADAYNNWQVYSPVISSGLLELISADHVTSKLFTIQGDSILVEIRNSGTLPYIKFSVPLVIDPWLVNEAHWPEFYIQGQTGSESIWGATGHISTRVSSSVDFDMYAFNQTYEAVQSPEDPNYNYTRGHQLPFPMALIELPNQLYLEMSIMILSP